MRWPATGPSTGWRRCCAPFCAPAPSSLKARPQTPARVVITEFVDVAHAFYAGPEPKMVNAVLDKIARVLRADEFESGASRPS
ncbi:MAG: hypothetical protein NVV74_20260 [Magnetospirillum sp.]|nr:hypothetical protein [Magnetospirillum sp.]